MNDSPKKNILNKIRMALEHPTPLPFPESAGADSFFQPPPQDLVIAFAEQFSQLQGKFIFCEGLPELVQHFHKLCRQGQWAKVYCAEEDLRRELEYSWYEEITACEAAVTGCEVLVARTGSIVLSSVLNNRVPSVYAPVHICIGFASQLVYDIKDALNFIKEKYRQEIPSVLSLASGPSRTADIEKTLVVGVHGPKEVYCLLVDNMT